MPSSNLYCTIYPLHSSRAAEVGEASWIKIRRFKRLHGPRFLLGVVRVMSGIFLVHDNQLHRLQSNPNVLYWVHWNMCGQLHYSWRLYSSWSSKPIHQTLFLFLRTSYQARSSRIKQCSDVYVRDNPCQNITTTTGCTGPSMSANILRT